MKHIKLILVLGILASGAIGAERATAGTCQTTSSSFPFFLSCNFRSEGYGYTDSGTKAVAAFLKSGRAGYDQVTTLALNSAGQGITNCKAVDTTIDINPVSDTTGCSTAAGGVVQSNWW